MSAPTRQPGTCPFTSMATTRLRSTFRFDQEPRRLTISFVASAAVDVAFVALLIWVSSLPVKPY